jgi:hypothetical protein
MPIRLPDRCGPDTVIGFLAAAEQRYADGLRLAETDRRTGAVYLWGYAVEMLLKAAYFRVVGSGPRQPILRDDLRAAVDLAPTVNCHFPGRNFHHLIGWSDLLICTRLALGQPYSDPRFPAAITHHTRRVYQVWRETLRYHQNTAYQFEVTAVREGVEWFLEQAARL